MRSTGHAGLEALVGSCFRDRLKERCTGVPGAMTNSIGNDFMGTAIGPDDTPWAGYYHSTGFAGRLVRQH